MGSDLTRLCGAPAKTGNLRMIFLWIGKPWQYSEFPAGVRGTCRFVILVHMGSRQCTIARHNAVASSRAPHADVYAGTKLLSRSTAILLSQDHHVS